MGNRLSQNSVVSWCSTISHPTSNNLYPRQELAEAAQPGRQVYSKEVSVIIPENAIQKLDQFAKYSGGVADIWECSWRQNSGMGKVTNVSAEYEQEFTVCMIFKVKIAVKLIRVPSGIDETSIRPTQKVSTTFEVAGRIFSFIGTYRIFVVELAFGFSWSMTIFSNVMALSKALGYFRR